MPKESQPSRVHRFIRWSMVSMLFGAVFLFILLFLVQFFTSNEDGGEQELDSEQESAQIVFDPEVVRFVDSYFDELFAGEYDELVRSYWTNSVVEEIRQECANPIEQDPAQPTRELWGRCGKLDKVDVEIVRVDIQDETTIVTIQFFDENKKIIGLDLYPEWIRGHELILEKGRSKTFRTSNWKFLST